VQVFNYDSWMQVRQTKLYTMFTGIRMISKNKWDTRNLRESRTSTSLLYSIHSFSQ
jgi:hypothetical protein